MKHLGTVLQVIINVALLTVFALAFVLILQTFGVMNSPAVPGDTQSSAGYPPPAPVSTMAPATPGGQASVAYPPPQNTKVPLTLLAPQLTSEAATRTFEATASAPTPIPTPGLKDGPICYFDPLNKFSLNLPLGWRSSSPPSPDARAGATVIYNYDPEKLGNEGKLPPGYLKIQVTSSKPDMGQSFDDWLSKFIEAYTGPAASDPLSATQPTAVKLGKHDGVIFTFAGGDYTSKEIVLPLADGKILIIGLTPADSSALSEGLAVLSTLDASGEVTCLSNPDGQ